MAQQNEEKECRKALGEARRIVIKLGTSTVTEANGELCERRVGPIVHGVAELAREGRQVVLVSSGAVGLGRWLLGLHAARLKDMAVKQACAAAGQGLLMAAYKRMFEQHEVKVAQVLLTEEDFSNWRRYSNLRWTMEKLIGFGVVPIVNENDSVSVRELVGAFGDNDELSALLAAAVEADWLLLLTDVDGFYAPNGTRPRLVRTIRKLTPAMEALCNGTGKLGRGGMRSKLRAAKAASEAGVSVIIVNGREPGAIAKAIAHKIGTYFPAKTEKR